MYDDILYDVDDPIATITLNRPDRLNAFTMKTLGEVRDAVGIPSPIHIAALVPLGYPARPFRPARRKAVEQVAYLDRWGQPLRHGPSGSPQDKPRG